MPTLGVSAFPPARPSMPATLASAAALLGRVATTRRAKTCVRPSPPVSVQANSAVPSAEAATVGCVAVCTGFTSSGASGADPAPAIVMSAACTSPPEVSTPAYALPFPAIDSELDVTAADPAGVNAATGGE